MIDNLQGSIVSLAGDENRAVRPVAGGERAGGLGFVTGTGTQPSYAYWCLLLLTAAVALVSMVWGVTVRARANSAFERAWSQSVLACPLAPNFPDRRLPSMH